MHVDGLTRATPRLQAADARGSQDAPPIEDASAWPELPPVEDPDVTADLTNQTGAVTLMSTNQVQAVGYIEVYTDKKSYLPGETINFHVSTTAEIYSIEIRKEVWSRPMIAKVKRIAGAYYPKPSYSEEPWAEGAKWPVGYSWVVPQEWESGSYLALVRTMSGDYKYAYHPFIVRTSIPGSRSKVAFVMNYNTRQAYNQWGGKSLYYTRVPGDNHDGVAVSFLRPFQDSYGRGKSYWGQWELVSQLIADGFDPEFLTEWDICSNPSILMAYDVLIFSGHHEYISRNTYDALEAFHHRGGHLAFFSANDIYWQVRFEDGGNKMVSYKSYAAGEDPMVGMDDSLVTTLWSHEPVNRPADTLQGVYYEPYSYCFEREDYIVQDADHFVFEGTGLQNGDALGWKAASSETDDLSPIGPPIMDVLLTSRRDRLTAAYKNSPYVQIDHVNAAAVYYEDTPDYGFPDGKGGQVFSAGTNHGWGDSIGDWSPGYETMRKVTKNIVQHMVDTPAPPADFHGLATAMSHWLGQCESPDWCSYADINMDGVVNITDFAYLADDWSSD